MILPRNTLSVAVSLAVLALILTLVLWYIPTYPETDFTGKYLNNFLYMVAFFIAAYWATGLQRRIMK
jgi:MFS superfamily sulfate permease-like transporter